MSENREPYVLELKALRDRFHGELTPGELRALERAIALLTADLFTDGALDRLQRDVNHVRRPLRRRGRLGVVESGSGSREPDDGDAA